MRTQQYVSDSWVEDFNLITADVSILPDAKLIAASSTHSPHSSHTHTRSCKENALMKECGMQRAFIWASVFS